VDHAPGVDAEKIAVEREVMDRAQRNPIEHRGDALLLGVRNDVRGLDEFARAACRSRSGGGRRA